MPKASFHQPSFAGGEWSPKAQGRTDVERSKTALQTDINYIPDTLGPLLRRGGLKYTGANVKDPSKPPAFLEFKFSQTDNYVIEFGDYYARFFKAEGQITTTSTHFKVSGVNGPTSQTTSGLVPVLNSSLFFAMRSSAISKPVETILQSSVIAASSVLEIQTPYSYLEARNLQYSQQEDVLYLVNTTHPEYKLTRFSNEDWDLRQVPTYDGPYLNLNSYKTLLDSDGIRIESVPLVPLSNGNVEYISTTGQARRVQNVFFGTSSFRNVLSANHGFYTGQRVVIRGTVGAGDINSGTSSVFATSWQVIKISDDVIELIGSNSGIGTVYTGSGLIYPALFQPLPISSGSTVLYGDIGRPVGLVRNDGGRAFGTITDVLDPSRFRWLWDQSLSPTPSGSSTYWTLGAYSRTTGFPGSITFHQDRKALAGGPASPQRVDMSVVGEYENFAASGSSFIVADDSALSFNLAAQEIDTVRWLRSDSQGLLAGSVSTEWVIAPNSQQAGLTPTNITAKDPSAYGSQRVQPVKAGNAVLYVQNGGRRIRELNYFFQVDTYRSTDLSELADHLTPPGIVKMMVQKEPIPVVWALREDGQMIGLSYGRDDQTLKVGWCRLTLGGSSDSAGTPPVITSAALIPSSDGKYDQLWCGVRRFINGTTVVTVEVMQSLFEEDSLTEDAFFLDSGATYDRPVTVTGITNTGSTIVTAPSHGFATGQSVQFTKVVGLQSSSIDARGFQHTSSFVNYRRFTVQSTSLDQFWLMEAQSSSFVSANGYGAYFSGGEVRRYVSTISGLTWLNNETVRVLGDGFDQGQAVVNSAGVLALTYDATKVQIGYSYKSQGQTLRQDIGAGDGTSIGKMRRVSKTSFVLHQVGDFKIGPSFDKMTAAEDVAQFFAAAQPQDGAQTLFSGVMREAMESNYDYDGFICFEQEGPLPGAILSLTGIIDEQDV